MSAPEDAGRAVVTGASGSIGRAVVHRLLEQGSPVIACDRTEVGMSDLRAAGATTVVTDLALATGRDELAAAVRECDKLVIAHGIIQPAAIEDATEADWEAIMSVNAKSVFFLCQRFVDVVRDGGAIVTLSSVSARSATSLEQSIYCASKAAVSSITRSFAHALAPRGIRVNALLPGIIEGNMQTAFLAETARVRGTTPDEIHNQRLRGVPLGRSGTADECASAILWLLSSAASYLSGQQIALDGGLTMV